VPQSFKLSALSLADAAHERSNFRFRHLLEKHACSEQMPELVNHRGEGKRSPSSYLARATPLPRTVMGVYDADVNVEHNETKESKLVFHPGATANGNGRMTKLFHEQRIRTSCCSVSSSTSAASPRRMSDPKPASTGSSHWSASVSIFSSMSLPVTEQVGIPVDKFRSRTLQTIR
jgi:hypothetical protein